VSVQIQSLGGRVGESFANGNFAAMIAAARACGDNVPEWNGTHDEQMWTAEHCVIMANRMRQMGMLAEIIEDCAKDGGFTIS